MRGTSLAGVAALVLLAACGSSSSSGGGGGSAIDSCLVGTWVATSVLATVSEVGAVANLTGGAGLTLTFSGDGSETADWSSMAALGTTIPVDITQTYRGQSHYKVSTGNGTLSFVSADYSGWSGEQTQAGSVTRLTGPDPVPSEAYTCSQTTLTEHSAGWQATFTRH